ncbi:MAG: DNA-protecting protein DprA [Rhodoferax sp.]|nr:DNA-protecting protein DprA [Rhodoferax sp.]
MERAELAAWLRLDLTPGIGNVTARRLLVAFGLPEAIFTQSAAALEQVVSTRQAEALSTAPEALPALLDVSLAWLQAEPLQRRILALGDAQYPASLLEMDDPPLLLYGMGAEAIWQTGALQRLNTHGIAIVGSRNPTPQGVANAQQFSQALSEAGLTIVSGLALGVDGAAHEGALQGAADGHLATIAVVGTGLDRVYPAQHRKLAHRICAQGLILSEYPLGTPPHAANFPQRNRIIAGLSRGTLVVEAALKSGSLITARLASEQGKDVFAIPGSIHSTQARGCHALIKQGAKLVEDAQDILEELGMGTENSAPLFIVDSAHSAGTSNTFDAESALKQALGHDPVGLDALLARTGLDTAQLQAQLMTMELEGTLVRLPGGLFQRIFRA